ncbi:endosulfine alpha b isoform X1 [Hypanus sabinus]|uniref:endosulfine alpha b isoform X1 n=1 Tax=Hypanus sabinus TaxID=79690 RepID=UPI0028C48763|nr:endosulfine alpha b isoform X1 [Hypanus sabinus]XP_059835986.1 endosulfine alpha b isoform X1 [Hypanus sabinus]
MEMEQMVDQCQLKATFPYLDNITICGRDWPDHNTNLQRFFQADKAFNLTYNRDKCVFGTTRLAILGKSATGTTLPAWLTSPGPVLLHKHARSNKYSPMVKRVHLLHANPQYAYVVLPDGPEDTVSVRDLVPAGAADPYPKHSTVTMNPVPTDVYSHETPRTPSPTQTPHDTPIPGISHTHEGLLTPSGLTPQVRPEPAQPPSPVQSPPVLHRSQRRTQLPDRLDL